jgi:2'-hydroxyisoflavone reductase
MTPTRRDFIKTTGVVGAGLALGGASACGGAASDGASALPTPKKLLIFGGTGFIGPHTVRYALERGHEVTIFTRGRSEVDLPPEVERLVGDRNDDHTALEGRTWDVVIDNNGQDYKWVETSTEMLKDVVDQYIFVSSISAYALPPYDFSQAEQVMYEPLVGTDYPTIDSSSMTENWEYGMPTDYGHYKAICENITMEAFPGRATIVRPGLIVGPGDRTNRFGYWPKRIGEGGEVLAPGNPEHANQVIDQRDLTEWVVRLAENGTAGEFNGTGPGERMSMGSMLEQIGEGVGSEHELTWLPESFLQEQGLNPWSDFPSWMPGAPLMFVDVSSAVASGLTFRPLPVTARDTLEFELSRSAEELRLGTRWSSSCRARPKNWRAAHSGSRASVRLRRSLPGTPPEAVRDRPPRDGRRLSGRPRTQRDAASCGIRLLHHVRVLHPEGRT